MPKSLADRLDGMSMRQQCRRVSMPQIVEADWWQSWAQFQIVRRPGVLRHSLF